MMVSAVISLLAIFKAVLLVKAACGAKASTDDARASTTAICLKFIV
jgi:hypothetical protein